MSFLTGWYVQNFNFFFIAEQQSFLEYPKHIFEGMNLLKVLSGVCFFAE